MVKRKSVSLLFCHTTYCTGHGNIKVYWHVVVVVVVAVSVDRAAEERSQYINIHFNIKVMKQETTGDEIRQIQYT